jgi:peptidoglycan-associated lipoprotein
MQMSVKSSVGTALLPLSVVILLNGCPTKPMEEKESGTLVSESGATSTSSLPGRSGYTGYTAADLNDPASPLYQRTIYFEYDSSDIRPQFIDILRAHASYISSNSTVSVTLDGHTDERGTREYNLALGDRRADTVRRFFLAEGVADSQIRTMSYGEERPANPGHSEAAWALNRRVELVY